MAEALLVSAGAYLRQAFAVGSAEVQKLRHDPFELFTRALQPVLWLVLFGEVMERSHGLTSGGLDYLDFLAAGILAQSVLFVAIFYGIAAIWERDLGILHRYLVSPAPRSALVLGKAASAGVRGLSQSVVVYVLAMVLGVAVSLAPMRLHRRGFMGIISTQPEERFLDEVLLDALADAGTPGRIRFADPDRVIQVETVDGRAGMSLWTREDMHRFPFLGVD